MISPNPSAILVVLGYTHLDAGQPQDALPAFDRAERALPAGNPEADPGRAAIDNGRALAWSMLGDLGQATSLEEKAVRLSPQTPSYWNQLARLYQQQGRLAEALRASEQAAALTSRRGQ